MGKPKIRFRGYTDDWEQRKLLSCIQSITDFRGRTPKKLGMDWSESGYLALSALNVKDGYIDFSQDVHYGNQELYDKWMSGKELHRGQVLFTTEAPMGNVAQVPDNKGYILSQRTIAFDVEEEILSENFLATLLRTPNVFNDLTALSSGGTAKGVSQKSLSGLDVVIPKNIDEQNKLADYFINLDHLITLHQRKCEETKKLKKYMLQKMFPQNGQVVPEIRFSGFTDDWEQRKFSELYEKNVEKNTELIGYDKTISIATMTYKDEGNGASDESLKTYKVLRTGDLAFEGHTNKDFRYGRFVANDIGTGIMSPRFSTLRPVKDMPVSFWKYYIHYEPIMRSVLVNSTKAGTMMNELVVADFMKQSIRVPSIGEQEKIGEYFSNLDHLITLHQNKCDELKKIKKFMLQNMFV
ncbi:MAG: restriction endonuclease subunit S [Lachnobacterium sp.]|nr:restriction endonuclease subunit S [Lachnobacterium sp.]